MASPNGAPSTGFQTHRPKRGANNFVALAKKIAQDAGLREQMLAVPQMIFMHDHNAPTVKLRRAMVRREFLSLMRALLTAEGVLPVDCSDTLIEQHCYHKDRIIDYGCIYLTAVGTDENTNRGRINERFKIGALRQRAEALWWFMIWHLMEEAGSIYPAWKLKSEAAMYKVAIDCSLGVEKYTKEYFGLPELWLLLQTILSSSDSASWMKQHYALWAIVAATGARPGSLALIEGYKGQPQYLKWCDIRFMRMETGPGLFLEIKLHWLKGQRDLHNIKATAYKGATFVLYPCRDKANLCADLTWILPQLALDRGLFGESTLEQLETSRMFELHQDPIISQQPVFLAGREGKSGVSETAIKPLSSSALNPVLQKFSRMAGLGVRSTIYSFRREFITTVARTATVDQAKELATHAPDTNSSYGRYDYGMGDLNVTEIRFGESQYATSGAARNELRTILNSPAVAKLNTPFDEDACRSYVIFSARTDQSVIEFDDSLRIIVHTLCQRFSLDKPVPSIMIKGLEELTTTPLSTVLSELSLPASPQLASEWQHFVDNAVTPPQAVLFLKQFLRARKNNRAFIYYALRKAYIKDWESDRMKPTLAQLAERKEVSRNPIILQDAAAATELQSRPNIPVHVEAWKTAANSARDRKVLSDEVDDSNSSPRWDGKGLNDIALDEDDSDDIETDVLDALADGARVVVAAADDTIGNPKQSDVDTASEYSAARQTLLRRWNEHIDIPRGKRCCPLCLAHPWKSEEMNLDSAFKFDRHVCAPTGVHNPGAGKGAIIEGYAKWCRDDETGKFICRLCIQSGAKERSYVEYSKLSKHLKQDHIDFCKRLLQ